METKGCPRHPSSFQCFGGTALNSKSSSRELSARSAELCLHCDPSRLHLPLLQAAWRAYSWPGVTGLKEQVPSSKRKSVCPQSLCFFWAFILSVTHKAKGGDFQYTYLVTLWSKSFLYGPESHWPLLRGDPPFCIHMVTLLSISVCQAFYEASSHTKSHCSPLAGLLSWLEQCPDAPRFRVSSPVRARRSINQWMLK